MPRHPLPPTLEICLAEAYSAFTHITHRCCKDARHAGTVHRCDCGTSWDDTEPAGEATYLHPLARDIVPDMSKHSHQSTAPGGPPPAVSSTNGQPTPHGSAGKGPANGLYGPPQK